MHVESIMALMRLSEKGDLVVAKLARMILGLVEALQDAERRAGLAEAALEEALARTARTR